jgi:hypothetical protein
VLLLEFSDDIGSAWPVLLHVLTRVPALQEPATAVDGDKGSTNKAGLIAGLTLMSIVIVAMVVGGVWAFKAGKIGGNRNNADQYAVDAPPPGDSLQTSHAVRHRHLPYGSVVKCWTARVNRLWGHYLRLSSSLLCVQKEDLTRAPQQFERLCVCTLLGAIFATQSSLLRMPELSYRHGCHKHGERNHFL